MILILTAGTWTWQWRMSREWAIYSESYDAIASGFLAGVSDPQYMSQIVADEGLRDRLIDYMRQQNLSVFAEPRARWMEHNVNDIAPLDDGTACSATVQTAEVSASDPPPLRVTGTLLEDARSHRHLDILMVDDTGTVRGYGADPSDCRRAGTVDQVFRLRPRRLAPESPVVPRGGRKSLRLPARADAVGLSLWLVHASTCPREQRPPASLAGRSSCRVCAARNPSQFLPVRNDFPSETLPAHWVEQADRVRRRL
ncbi:MAG: hypothetical protein WDO73_33665 [Ignavibacteriota bacterium]